MASFICVVFAVVIYCIDPLKPSVVMWLHFECSAPYRPNLLFLISDIRGLRAECQSARMSEIKNVLTNCVNDNRPIPTY